MDTQNPIANKMMTTLKNHGIEHTYEAGELDLTDDDITIRQKTAKGHSVHIQTANDETPKGQHSYIVSLTIEKPDVVFKALRETNNTETAVEAIKLALTKE